MRSAFAILIGIHGLIHLLGPTKAFGWAKVPQLGEAISPLGGAFWLVAAILLVGAPIAFALGAHGWWWLGLPGSGAVDLADGAADGAGHSLGERVLANESRPERVDSAAPIPSIAADRRATVVR